MPSDLSIVVAEMTRMQSIREGMILPGRAMHFTGGNLGSALESIKTHRPRLVAVDAMLARTPAGVAFVDRVEKLGILQSEIRHIVQLEGRWVTAPRGSASGGVAVEAPAAVAAPAPAIVPAPAPTVVAAQAAVVSTRRAPRFLVRDALDAVVESGSASLVDISVLGAQVVSKAVLRPSQKIKIALPDTREMLNVTAHVAWSTFEKPKLVTDVHYRAGLEFTDAAQEALEDYRLRHCNDVPIPYRGR